MSLVEMLMQAREEANKEYKSKQLAGMTEGVNRMKVVKQTVKPNNNPKKPDSPWRGYQMLFLELQTVKGDGKATSIALLPVKDANPNNIQAEGPQTSKALLEGMRTVRTICPDAFVDYKPGSQAETEAIIDFCEGLVTNERSLVGCVVDADCKKESDSFGEKYIVKKFSKVESTNPF